ncbi:pre-mRNA processing RNA-helicase [Rhizophlyctis rosea]|nr:pre-mRNA processing RNA-helicase [Rhizophlyctis rosea]
MKALTASGVSPPAELEALADAFIEKVKSGNAQYSSSGFGGKGLEKLDKERDLVKKIQKKSHGGAYDDGVESDGEGAEDIDIDVAIKAAQEAAAKINAQVPTTGKQKAQDIVAAINARFKESGLVGGGMGVETKKASEAAFSIEIPINDYPQKARWKVTNKEQINQITEISGAAITTRGVFVAEGKPIPPGEKKLFLFVEGDSQLVIDRAKVEIKRILTDATVQAMESEAAGGRYKVIGGETKSIGY